MAKSEESGKDSGNWLAAGVAVLAVVLFIGWLATRDEPERVTVAEPGQNAATPPDESGATPVTTDELTNVARVNALRGQDVRIERAEAIAAMGDHLFWMQLPGGSPFLVRLDSALVASGMRAPATGFYEIVGRIQENTETLRNEWLQSGVLRNENDKMQAEFGSSYLEARRLRPVSG